MPLTKPTLLADTLFKFKDTLARRKKYVRNQHQAYGLMLAEELDDWKNRALYIRLAKNTSQEILETARLFVKDQLRGTIKSKAKLFMWKVGQINHSKPVI
jgi:hypothetical protein